MKNIFKGIYASLYDIYDNLTAKSCIVSIGDITLKRANIDSAQFTTATRLLDVKNFILFGNADFVYQNTVSKKLWGVNHDETRGNNSFYKIIKSYQKSGYIKDSVVEVDKSLRLINGTHRTACNLFFEYYEISVKSIGRNILRNNAPFLAY